MQRSERRLMWIIGLSVWFILALNLPPGGMSASNRYMDLTYAFINQGGTLNIDAYQDNTVDKAFYQGHYYIAALPGPSLLSIPSYLAFKAIYAVVPKQLFNAMDGIRSLKADDSNSIFMKNVDPNEFYFSYLWIKFWTLCLLSALATVYLIKLLRVLDFSLPLSVLGGLIYAFGTGIFYFSTVYFAHALLAAFIVFTLYQCAKALKEGGTQHRYILIGFFAGMSALMEYPGLAVPVLAGLFVLFVGKRQAVIAFVAGVAAPLIVLGGYNTFTFGSPIALSQQYMNGPFWNRTGQGLDQVISMPTLDRIWGLTFSPERGLFTFSPILLLAPFGFFIAFRKDKKGWLFFSLVVLLILSDVVYNILLTDWRGGAGMTFGSRYILPTMGCWIIGVIYCLRRTNPWIWVPFVIVSVWINWLGAMYGATENIGDFVRQFFTTGPIPHALTEILLHSSETNRIHQLILTYRWPLTLVYGIISSGLLVNIYVNMVRVDKLSDPLVIENRQPQVIIQPQD